MRSQGGWNSTPLRQQRHSKQRRALFNTSAALVVHTDRGTAFHNEKVDELLRMSGVEQSLTTSYSSEENGIVERANQEVLRHSRVHDKWSFDG